MSSEDCAEIRANILDRLDYLDTLNLTDTERGRILISVNERDARGETDGRIAPTIRRLAAAMREADEKCPGDVPELEALIRDRLGLKNF